MKPVLLRLSEIRSYLYENLLEEWHPDPAYIDYLKRQIKQGEYLPPIIVGRDADGDGYVIITGAHRVYAYLVMGKERIKAIVVEDTYEGMEPVRKAEVLLKEYDEKTEYKYQFSGFLHRWAAAAEEHDFINSYRPVHRIDIYHAIRKVLKAIVRRLFPKNEVVGE